jgi:hypothetical protein
METHLRLGGRPWGRPGDRHSGDDMPDPPPRGELRFGCGYFVAAYLLCFALGICVVLALFDRGWFS